MAGRYRAYPEYKDSGVEWLGEVPCHWDVIQIKHLSCVKRGASPRPIDDAKYFDEDGEYAWTRIADVTASNVYLKESPQKLSDLGSSLSIKLQPGSLFPSIAGTVGKPCITGIKACIHDGFVYFPELVIPNKYLFYVFAGGQAYQGLGKFGTQLNLNTDTVGGIKVGIQENSELCRIVDFLDHETAKIDTLIEKQQQLITLLQEKRQAVISHAVTRGLNPDAPMKDSGVEWLGEVPEHWVTKSKLLNFADNSRGCFVNGPFGSDLLSSELREEGVPVIYIRDLKTTGYKRVSTVFVSKEKANQLEVCKTVSGDILIAKVGDPPGDACIYPKDEPVAIITQDVIRIRVNQEEVSAHYLTMLLNSNYGKLVIDDISVESTRKRVSLGDFKSTRFPRPPFEEQVKIACYINTQCKKLDALIKKAKKAIDLSKERRTALISAAVTGKIDVRSWQPPTSSSTSEHLQ
ncbi:restriction endonuclease subunit S [Desulforhopalus vacuolatus]|uniref:restriction endonuclease subunit S n=1 Tax=Desulforhopalus vacuolatus TaxID=40414 RepID=UPI00196439FC|nr:restriction endonuclease subunit S [Desulforhopalus vacuolatus]MBM9521123.1 restriction endonuclease subunit S [Desulforhopalus vacuolatus]